MKIFWLEHAHGSFGLSLLYPWIEFFDASSELCQEFDVVSKFLAFFFHFLEQLVLGGTHIVHSIDEFLGREEEGKKCQICHNENAAADAKKRSLHLALKDRRLSYVVIIIIKEKKVLRKKESLDSRFSIQLLSALAKSCSGSNYFSTLEFSRH